MKRLVVHLVDSASCLITWSWDGPIGAILFPIHHGMLYFTGLAVIEPFLVHAPARIGDDERQAYLARYRDRVLGLGTTPTLSYAALAEYDADLVLKRSLWA